MTNSALSVPTFKALSGNIFNADGSTPIYSAGAWDFKNASAVSVMQISSTGQVNLVQKCLTVSGNVDSFTGGSRAIFDITSGIARVCAGVVAGSSSSIQLITHLSTGASTSEARTGIEIAATGAVAMAYGAASIRGTTSCNSGSATTIYTIAAPGMYEVWCSITVEGAGSTYICFGTVVAATTNAADIRASFNNGSAGSNELSLSGFNIQYKQSSGLARTAVWSILRIN